MASWDGKSRGSVIGYRIFVWSIMHLGLNFAYFLLFFVTVYFVFASKRAFGSIFYFFHNRLEQSRFKSIISIFRNYYLLGQGLIDKTAVLAGLKDKFNFILEGKEHLLQMRDGGIIISGHIGNWEVGGKALDCLDKKVNLVIIDDEGPAIKKYISDILTDRNVHFIKIGNDFSHLFKIKEALENKELVAFLGDRFIEGNQTVKIDFLGEPALFPLGPWHMASYFNVPVSYVFAVKESRKQYRFYATPLKIIPSAKNPMERSKLVWDSIREFVSEFERITRKYPHQWHNYYNFWK
ncbi:MAG: lipid A biosynthesis acyltransferase [Bacteroidetes bacterium]|nr:MAG: lipid A biosynthesis acyltransferase [Bacteroidota bacterium]